MPSTIFNLPSSKTNSHTSKIHISHTHLPQTYLDPSHPPTTRPPFKQFRSVPFVRNITLCMPTRVYEALYDCHKHDHDHNRNRDTAAKHDCSLASFKGGPELRYAKVIMPLSDIVSDHALRTGNHALFSAPSPPGANGVTISLNAGRLTLDMPQATYQKSGLPFPVTKVGSGGRKHEGGSGRVRVEIDLRGPGMVKGRKGFERLMRASRCVEGLSEGRVWLFCEVGEGMVGRKRKRGGEGTSEESNANVQDATDDASSSEVPPTTTSGPLKEQDHPLAKHHPTLIVEPGTIITQHDVLIPNMISSPKYLSSLSTRSSISAPASEAENVIGNGCLPTILEDDIHELVEYLGLLCLRSPRITKGDYGRVDPYLCRYVLPSAGTAFDNTGAGAGEDADVGDMGREEGEIEDGGARDGREGDADVQVEDVTSVQYSGFMSSDFVMQLVVDVIRRSRVWKSGEGSAQGRDDEAGWMTVNVDAFQTEAIGGVDGYLILLQSSEAGGAVGEAAEEMPCEASSVEVGDLGRQHNANEKLAEKRGREARGFRYVTCFEFVDSTTR